MTTLSSLVAPQFVVSVFTMHVNVSVHNGARLSAGTTLAVKVSSDDNVGGMATRDATIFIVHGHV